MPPTATSAMPLKAVDGGVDCDPPERSTGVLGAPV